MYVKEVMTRSPEAISHDDNSQQAARRMADLNVGFMPVTEADKLVGVLTDRDLAVRVVAEGRDPQKTPASEIMTREVETIAEDQDIEDAAALMKEKQIRRIVVRDTSGVISGVVALGDLAVELGDKDLYASTLEKVSEPVHPKA